MIVALPLNSLIRTRAETPGLVCCTKASSACFRDYTRGRYRPAYIGFFNPRLYQVASGVSVSFLDRGLGSELAGAESHKFPVI